MKYLLFGWAMLLAQLSWAQPDPLSDERMLPVLGAHVGVTQVAGVLTYMPSGRVALRYRDRMLVGAFASFNLVDRFRHEAFGAPARLYMGEGGLWLGYEWPFSERFGISAHALMGYGGTSSELNVGPVNQVIISDGESSDYLMAAPQVELSGKIESYLRVYLGMAYRFHYVMSPINFPTSQDLNAFGVYLGIQVEMPAPKPKESPILG
jgi:hypothetical protein